MTLIELIEMFSSLVKSGKTKDEAYACVADTGAGPVICRAIFYSVDDLGNYVRLGDPIE